MDLLERYLQAVGEYLPAKTKADTLAELRENLLAQMEAREEELGRPLTDAEVSEVLVAHGRPMLVAARYLPQQQLIGPGLFPIYWFTLKKSFPLVVLAYAVAQIAAGLFQGFHSFDIGTAILHFPGVALTFWAIMTLGFAAFEYAGGRCIPPMNLSSRWNPNDLPPVNSQEKKPSVASGVAEVIVSALVLAWLLAIPFKPYLILGPGTGILHGMPFGLTPEWHIFYWQIIGLLGVQLTLKLVMLFLREARRWRKVVDLVVQVMGILILTVMVQARSYFVPVASAGALSLTDLVSINTSVNLAFKIALAVSVVKLLWDVWKMVVASRPEQTGLRGDAVRFF